MLFHKIFHWWIITWSDKVNKFLQNFQVPTRMVFQNRVSLLLYLFKFTILLALLQWHIGNSLQETALQETFYKPYSSILSSYTAYRNSKMFYTCQVFCIGLVIEHFWHLCFCIQLVSCLEENESASFITNLWTCPIMPYSPCVQNKE